jgi:nucleoside-diphosphate-sugar epimerase
LQGFHVLNVSTTQETSINQLVAYFEKAAGKKLVVRYAAKREGDIYRSFLDNRELLKVLQLQPEMALPQGILQTYNWYRQEKGGH